MMVKIFLEILNMSITAGYCVIAVVLLRLLLKKQPKIYSYILWSVVFFRMICPVSIKSVFSFLRFNTRVIQEDLEAQEVFGLSSGYDEVVNFIGSNAADSVVSQTVTDVTANADSAIAGGSVVQMILFAAITVWLIGMFGLIIYSLAAAIRLKKKLKWAVHKETNIYEAEGLSTPFVFGFIKPKIYLPGSIGEPEKSFVLKHELTHIHRKDYIIKPVAFFIVCMHWFNPLAWLAFYLMSKDMEMSCDESVIRKLTREETVDYSQTLLTLASNRRGMGMNPLSFGKGNVKERIKNILRYKKPVTWVTVVIVAVLTVVLIGLAVNPKDNEPSDSILALETSSEADTSTEENEVQEYLEKIEVSSEFEDSTGIETLEAANEEVKKDKVLTMDDLIEMSSNYSYSEYDFNEYTNGIRSPYYNSGYANEYALQFDLEYKGEEYTVLARYMEFDYGMDLSFVAISGDNYPYSCYLYHEAGKRENMPNISAMIEGYDFYEDVSYELPEGLTDTYYNEDCGVKISYADSGEEVGSISPFVVNEVVSWNDNEIKYIGHANDDSYSNFDLAYEGENVEGFDSAAYVDRYEIDYYAHSGYLSEELETVSDEKRFDVWWRVHLARPGENFGYVVKLDARYFTKEDAINLAKTLKF